MKPIIIIIILSITTKSCDDAKHIYIADHLVDCVGVAPQKCMLVKDKIGKVVEDEDTTRYIL